MKRSMTMVSAAVLAFALGGCQTQGGFDLAKLMSPQPSTGAATGSAGKTGGSTQTSTGAPARLMPSCQANPSVFYADPSAVDWPAVYSQCPASALAAYNAAVALLNTNRTEEALALIKSALADHPGDAGLQGLQTAATDPFTRVSDLVNARLQAWLKRPSEVGEFTRVPPQKPSAPALPNLVKDEFETAAQFQVRVEKAKQQRQRDIEKLEQDYRAQVDAFNRAVSTHNAALRGEQDARQKAIPAQRLTFLQEAIAQVLGAPRIQDLNYDAENQLFYATVVSSNRNFERKVTVKVPRDAGRQFKADAANLDPRMRFEVSGNAIVLKGLDVVHAGKAYVGSFTDETYRPTVMTASAETLMPRLDDVQTLKTAELDVKTLVRENDDYFQTALNLQEDPKLARLRQQQAEQARQLREAAFEKQRAEEILRIQENLRRQQEQLVAMGGQAGEDYKGLTPKKQWAFRRARFDGAATVAVIIGNRDYQKGVPLVHYALNDAKAMRQFVTEGLGVPTENVIYEEDATKGVMEGIFRSQLHGRVEPGKTDVFVYFSGHGIPDENRSAQLLPVDARPNTASVTGYPRDTMLSQIAALNPRTMTVVMDSCFSGTAKDGEALTDVKAILPEAKSAAVPANGLLISASSGNQTSWMDDETGMSLLTLNLLDGLSGGADANGDKAITSTELGGFLRDRVNRAALRLHQQPQQPEVIGADRVIVTY